MGISKCVHTVIREVWLPWPAGHCTTAGEGLSHLPGSPAQVTSPQGLAPITQTLHTLKTRNGIRTTQNVVTVRLSVTTGQCSCHRGCSPPAADTLLSWFPPRGLRLGGGCTSLEQRRRTRPSTPSTATGPRPLPALRTTGCQRAQGAFGRGLCGPSLFRAPFSWQSARLYVSIPQTRPWATVSGASSEFSEFSLPSTFPHSKLSQFYCNYFTNLLLYVSRVLA